MAVSSKQAAMSLLNVYRIALPNGAAGTDRNYGRLLSFVQLCESEAELNSPADDKSKIKLANARNSCVHHHCARGPCMLVQTSWFA